jgi:predicted phage terminase large subunit-like protein
MIVDDQIELLAALQKSFARKNLIDFSKFTFKNYKPSWHHYLLADRLEMLARGEIKRLAVNMPPRHGKSELVSVRFPAWYLGNHPSKNIISVSHNTPLAAKNGKKARNTVASVEFRQLFREVQLSEESAAKLDWTLEATLVNKPCPYCGSMNWNKKLFGRAICKSCGKLGEFAGSNTVGEYFGAGIEGGVTGRGADVLIIDDPHKDRKEANSLTIRNNIWDWYTSTALQRLEESNCVCVCQTRWHEDDLTGRVLSKANDGTEKWHVLSLKAIAEEDEEHIIYNPDYCERLGTNVIKRRKGEPLWNNKFPLERLNAIRAEIDSFEFSAEYQQSPHPMEGGLFKRENILYCKIEGDHYYLMDRGTSRSAYIPHCTRFSTVDLASRTTESADYTVVCTWDLTKDNDLILRHIFRKRVEGAEHLNLLWSIYELLSPQEINIENTAYQISLIQSALKEGLPVKSLKADRDKFSRALPAAAKFESHKVFLLNSIPEIPDIENELLHFPNGRHDDIVDCFGYAASRAANITKLKYAAPPQLNKLESRKQFYEQLK